MGCICALLSGPALGAITTTGNVTPNPQTTTSSSTLYIGQSAPGTMLVNAGSDVLSGGTGGYVAFAAGTTGAATVDGAGSTWRGGNLYVGNLGAGSLDVTSGGFVSNVVAQVGLDVGSSGDVRVDGAGSIWSSSGITNIGNRGTGTLEITNGGQVKNTSTTGSSAIGFEFGGSGTVIVDGIGSKWENSGGLWVGNRGSGALTIRNGGQVSNGAASVGGIGVAATASVDGVGSIWSSQSLSVGGSSPAGSVTVTNGAQLKVLGSLTAGPYGTANFTIDNSQASVGGTTNLQLNSAGYGIILNNSTLTTNSLAGYFSELSGTGVVNTHGLNANMDLVFDATHGLQRQFIVDSDPNQNVTINLDVNGTGVLGAAYDGVGTLTIAEGVTVASVAGEIGYLSKSNGTATVDGAGTKWNVTNALRLGSQGQGTLSITNGARINSGSGVVGNSVKASAATVHGAGSMWANTSDLFLDNGSLQVLAGAKVMNRNGQIGDTAATSTLTIDGATSTWANSGTVYVGYHGVGSLAIANGALVTGDRGYVGYFGPGTASVDGTASTWNCTGDLYVNYGWHGTLQVTNGGTVNSNDGVVGRDTSYTANATIDGSASSWNMTGALEVGRAGVLNIVNGAHVSVALDTIARNDDGPGLINFNNGTLTTRNLLAGAGSLMGTGIINARGLVTDGDIVPTKVGGVWQPLQVGGQTNHNLTINLNLDSADEFGAGFDAQGTLTLTNGQIATSANGTLGYNVGSAGIAHVTGPGSGWNVSGFLKIGDSGSGTLEISTAAKVTTRYAYVADAGTSTGVATVTGAGTEWVNDVTFDVGLTGNGKLTISEGGKVTSVNTEIGIWSGGVGKVDVIGAGSTLSSGSTGTFYVGYYGNGTLNITNGGTVTSGAVTVAYNSGSTGAVTVSGSGASWNIAQNLTLGNVGPATLGIANGGVVDVVGNVSLGSATGGKGTVNLGGGVLRMHGGTLTKGSGTATFNLTGGRLEGAGTIALGAAFVQSGGTFAPGNPQGTTTITGGYTLDTGKLEFDLNGVPSPLKDQVTVTGQVNLVGANGAADGVLNLVLGFAPSIGSQFLLISNDGTDAVVGTFASGSIAKAAFNNALYTFGINYATNVGNNDVVLTTQSVGVLGDFSGDGVVDGGDYLVWRKSLGGNVNRFFGADGNGNGTIDDGDYEVWRSRFGTTTAGLGTGALADIAVPEPTTLALVAMLLLLVLPRYGAFHSWRTLPS